MRRRLLQHRIRWLRANARWCREMSQGYGDWRKDSYRQKAAAFDGRASALEKTLS